MWLSGSSPDSFQRELKAHVLLGMLRELGVHEDVSSSLKMLHLCVHVTGSELVCVVVWCTP